MNTLHAILIIYIYNIQYAIGHMTMYIYIYLCIYTNIYICMIQHTHIHTYIHTHIYIYTYTVVHVYTVYVICIYIYTYIYHVYTRFTSQHVPNVESSWALASDSEPSTLRGI